MTQQAFFTKEAIIEAAFEITQEEGWSGVTARRIAKKLGSSTMPIYSSMKSMEEIASEVRARAEKLMIEFQTRSYAGADANLGAAIGYVTFARDQRSLFRFLYVDRPLKASRERAERNVREQSDKVLAGLAVANLQEQLPVAMSDPRILKSWIFTHGLASMVSSGVLDLPDERIRSLLMEAGAAFFTFSDEEFQEYLKKQEREKNE